MKAFIHVQHLLGSGHIVRAVALGKALVRRGIAVTLATGNVIPETVDCEGMTVVKLPAVRAASAKFDALLDANGTLINEAWWEGRIAATLSAFSSQHFDLLITETYPFGRRMFSAEMTRLLEQASAEPKPPWVVCSVRDLLVRKDESWKEEWMASQALAFYDRILVHSDPQLITFEESFPYEHRVSSQIRYTGYISDDRATSTTSCDGKDEIIVSCGGGAVGSALLRAALSASNHMPANLSHKWRILVGQDIPEEEFGELSKSSSSQLIIERARKDFPALLRNAKLSISQAGYNTVVDILRAGIPSVLVPFAQEAETEQTQRSLSLMKHQRAVAVPEKVLNAKTLAQAAQKALSLPVANLHVALNGAEISAQVLAADLGIQTPTDHTLGIIWERNISRDL
ncbi:UDP-N-acetylglucosamine--N-acetylmuramyl-(pentapeptide) pyrophosphoryl-undecaprenol N-acetylglucosamine transferase [Pseudovibrio axinellae]|uniref:UDP-N-acetylglucosamine--N-acetylmuramyl-(Pentapeptide) pyrophosphoryl-undecaprenol N-acetylglucosamine transferase n=1 Tax=Pseudovibrio axinellae TaxID=989403 RepID=A0A166AFT5_9HYPH|nr:glycosyltransferase [Pseudovibrio axinellae]KZL21011.1 UDP-N-acetylglucosamine--N-acetylmuramyl-(pentapeptide) pyrophosphoryl-undecaprenol N-acetylglucosamine transferase [Pseudovibrio axinellae]SEP79074.1 Predicted glycosyl transferase [Pseudovibrio axinellae]